jgi:hypothetical protein
VYPDSNKIDYVIRLNLNVFRHDEFSIVQFQNVSFKVFFSYLKF